MNDAILYVYFLRWNMCGRMCSNVTLNTNNSLLMKSCKIISAYCSRPVPLGKVRPPLRFPPHALQLTATDEAPSPWRRVHLREDQTLNPDKRRNQALVVKPKNGAFLQPACVNTGARGGWGSGWGGEGR